MQLLQTASAKQRNALLLTVSNKQLKVLYNVYNGTLPLSRYYIDKLYPFKQDIETIIDRDIKHQIKIELLVKK